MKLNKQAQHVSLDQPNQPLGTSEILKACRRFQSEDPSLRARYLKAKQVIRAFRNPSFYEITTRCNLKCEGCYYFEGGSTANIPETMKIDAWEQFFATEAQRDVSIAYFVGAEPALAQDRLFAAAPHFPFGKVGTNGTVKIDPALPFRIGVSLWASDDMLDKRLRGGSVFRKALKNYAGDPRAIILFTVSNWTVDQIPTIAEICADYNLPLTFNIYSPTQTFNRKLAQAAPNDSAFFRVSSQQASPRFDDEALDRMRRAMNAAIDKFPDTVIYSKYYNDYICQPGSRYTLDPDTGIALDCQSRIQEPMRYHDVSLTQNAVKCCTPDVDCATCRMYGGGWSSQFMPRSKDIMDIHSFSGWIDSLETLGQIMLYPARDHQRASSVI